MPIQLCNIRGKIVFLYFCEGHLYYTKWILPSLNKLDCIDVFDIECDKILEKFNFFFFFFFCGPFQIIGFRQWPK
jgi:hypothetical protein